MKTSLTISYQSESNATAPTVPTVPNRPSCPSRIRYRRPAMRQAVPTVRRSRRVPVHVLISPGGRAGAPLKAVVVVALAVVVVVAAVVVAVVVRVVVAAAVLSGSLSAVAVAVVALDLRR